MPPPPIWHLDWPSDLIVAQLSLDYLLLLFIILQLKHEISMANSELTSCRREMGRLKAKCLEFEDDIMGYRADISRWKTLYEQKSPQRPPVAADFDQQRQV